MKNTFTINLRKVRKVFKNTQAEAASKIGTKRSTYQAWETGRAQPSSEVLVHIATIFEISNLQGFITDPDFDWHSQAPSSIKIPDHPVLVHYAKTTGKVREAVNRLLGIGEKSR